ncbi:MAG: DUF4340 domain-containing protein [Clostridiales bacterium]|jgi:hypothetical protein|nr:DUF4340 domain-containing protein [Clostridiales bacterium]
MIKKRQKLIIIIAAAAAVLLVLYFAVLAPMLKVDDSKNEEIPNLLPGEVLGTNNRILLMEHIEKADIQSIEVHNEHGSYTMYRGDDDQFYLEGNEGAPYSMTALSSLVVSSGYTLSMTRVTEDCSDMSIYGLADSDDPAWYVITKVDGNSHKVYIGDMIPTGAGYYVKYGDRNAVYVLEGSLAATLLADVRDIITPILSYPISSTNYFQTKDFYIYRHGEPFVWITYLDDEEVKQQAKTGYGVYKMLYPTDYTPSSTNYDAVLQKFANFVGTRVVELGNTGDTMPDETLLKYGIDPENPAYLVHYNYSGVDNYIMFSEPQEDGTYYAYSMLFNLIATVSPDTVNFLNWDLIKFVDRPIFQKNINDVSKIEIISKDANETFFLEGEGTTIQITPQSTGKTFDADMLQNFRQFYKVMLSLEMEDYTENESTDDLYLTMIITTDAGVVTEYKFYPYSTRRCFYTINGEGEFYCLRDWVEKVAADCNRAVTGEAIDSEGKY